jgi:hypothetical protein
MVYTPKLELGSERSERTIVKENPMMEITGIKSHPNTSRIALKHFPRLGARENK